jgi:hypothetical protein
MEFNLFQRNVINWAKERKIIPNSNNKAQYIKLIEELGELALGIRKQDRELTRDSIGDVAVVLVILAGLNNINLINRYKFTGYRNNFYTLSDRIGGIGEVLQEKAILKANFRPTLKSQIKKALYALMDLTKEYGYNFNECIEVSWNEIKDRKGILRPDGIFVKEADL